jgi:hypothetical protein
MDKIAIQNVHELDPSARAWLQKVAGREFKEEEQISVRVTTVRPAPPANARQAAGAKMDQLLDKMAANMKDVSEDEFDAALDEAMKAIRPSYERMP